MVLPTKIPVACVGVLTILDHAPQFSARALTRSRGWDEWLPWQELPSADSRTMAPPGTTLLRAYQLPKLGSALPGNSPSPLTWQAGVPGPFPGYPRPLHCPRGRWRPGPRISGSPVPTTLSRPPMGPWPTALPGARGTHSAILTVRSHAPNPSTGLLRPSKQGSSLHSHQQQNNFHFCQFV